MAAVVLATAALIAMLFVQGYLGGGDSDALEAYAEASGDSPVDLIVSGAGARRIIVIGDVAGRAEPKRIAQGVLEQLALSLGVDALVVDLDSTHQSALDRYTGTTPEDASILTRAPRLLASGEGGRQSLELYRAVWALNQELGADRRVRILAAGPGPWPPTDALPPKEAAEAFARRGTAMADRIEEQMLGRTSRSRVIALVDALQALRSGPGEIQVGGGRALEVDWLAATLAERYPVDVYSALPDLSLERTGYPVVAQYAGTRLYERLQKAIPARMVGLPVGGPLVEVRDPLLIRTGPGITMSLPEQTTLRDMADAYIFIAH